MLYSDLKDKDVIDIRDCRKLGKICDLEIDCCRGCLEKIIVSPNRCLMDLFKTDTDVEITFENIAQIGPDIILVDIK